jgi:hypothetical protein
LQHLVLLTDLHSNKPHLTACCSDRSRYTAADRWIWLSIPLRNKWQDWIAPAGRIIVPRECRQGQHYVALSGSIPLQPAAGHLMRKVWTLIAPIGTVIAPTYTDCATPPAAGMRRQRLDLFNHFLRPNSIHRRERQGDHNWHLNALGTSCKANARLDLRHIGRGCVANIVIVLQIEPELGGGLKYFPSRSAVSA